MTERRRRYTKKERILAVVAADVATPEKAGETMGIPVRNIYRWREDPEMAEYIAKTRDALADDILVAAALAWSKLVDRIRAGDIDTRDLIVAAGVAVDKSQLLSGAATSRTESRDISGTLSDNDLIAAVREAEQITSAGGTPPPPASEATG